MIAFLRGKIFNIGNQSEHQTLVMDVQGVGYELHCSSSTLSDLEACLQNEVSVYVHTHVREDALTLYGFSTVIEKELFLSLNKVNGVGPKMAQKILSGTRVENLLNMIESEDTVGLSKLPKVGKKTAEQIVLSLKGKLPQPSSPHLGNIRKDIVSALVNLGFKLSEVEKTVTKMPQEIALEEGVRQGLQALTNI